MKFMTKYYLKRGAMFLGMMALPFAFGGCEKDPEQPDNNTPQKTEEFIYNTSLYFWRPGSSNEISRTDFMDTVAKLSADPSIKQIHISPDFTTQFGTITASSMNTKANVFNDIYNQSHQKLSGENTTLYLSADALQSSNVQSVLHNKLKIELLQIQY